MEFRYSRKYMFSFAFCIYFASFLKIVHPNLTWYRNVNQCRFLTKVKLTRFNSFVHTGQKQCAGSSMFHTIISLYVHVIPTHMRSPRAYWGIVVYTWFQLQKAPALDLGILVGQVYAKMTQTQANLHEQQTWYSNFHIHDIT